MRVVAALTICVMVVFALGISRGPEDLSGLTVEGQASVPVLPAQPPETEGEDEKPDQEPEEISPLRIFMRKKLQYSNRILEGLLVDNMKMVVDASDELLEISSAERWRASNDMMYLQHSDEFRTSVRQLRDKAKLGSIDGAALAWVDVTMNCLHCHEWVRNTIIADLPDRTLQGIQPSE